MPKYRAIMDAIETLNGIDPKVLENLNASPRLLEAVKAHAQHAEELRPGERVEDLYMDYHREPSEHEISVGPSLEASGGGTRRAARYYDADLVGSPQIDSTSRLGKMLETLEDMTKAVRNMLEKAERVRRDRMQSTFPSSARGENGGAERRPGDEPEDDEERERREHENASKSALDIAAALRGDSPLEMNVRAFFNAVMGKGFTLAKSNLAASALGAVEKAVDAGILSSIDSLAVRDLLMHAEAVSSGAYPAWQFARELGNVKPELAAVLAKAVLP